MKKLVVGSLIASSLLNLGCGIVDGIQSSCQDQTLKLDAT